MVCICNVHSIITARSDAIFAQAVRDADLATPDGAPVAWMLRRSGFAHQERISGPDLMWAACEEAEKRGLSVFLYGSTPATLKALEENLRTAFPRLQIAGAYSPPFRPLSEDEATGTLQMLRSSGAQIIWVSLGCPKQELWMHRYRDRIDAVMVGVGAAFDFHAGKMARAPKCMQRMGLEWLHRLYSEPRRLWKRYLVTNSKFVALAVRELLFRPQQQQQRRP